MTIAHHPRLETLASLAAGTLSPGPRLVVTTHLAGCRECRNLIRGFEAVGGAFLEGMPPCAVAPEFLPRTLALLDPESIRPGAPEYVRRPATPGFPEAPAPLRGYPIGPWLFIQPGLRISRVAIPEDHNANVILLKVGAGRRVPHHGHEGTEYTQVLSGAFSDALGHYVAGDCIEADDDIDHQPVVDNDGECICLAAVEGRLRLHSFVARLLQPFLGI